MASPRNEASNVAPDFRLSIASIQGASWILVIWSISIFYLRTLIGVFGAVSLLFVP